MKIKKFNESFEYSPGLKNKRENFGWDKKVITKYHVGSPRNEDPIMYSYSTLEEAFNKLEEENNFWGQQTYAIFKTQISLVPDKEIDLEITTKKYNIL